MVGVLPDLIGALIARYRGLSGITTLTSTRISAALQDAWDPMPRHAMLLSGPIGSPATTASDQVVGKQRTRVDIFFYGATPYEAMRLWRTAHPYICPRQDTVTQFVQSGCRVGNVLREGGPTRGIEPDTGWPFVLATYVYDWIEGS